MMLMTIKNPKVYIIDKQGHYYKRNSQGQLVVAQGEHDATTFLKQDAQNRIGVGRKARFYDMLAVPDDTEEVTAFDVAATAPTVNDKTASKTVGADIEDWLKQLCDISTHISDHKISLEKQLSDVDLEVCDIMHYLEFAGTITQEQYAKASKMLQECQCRRRSIKDEIRRIDIMTNTFMDAHFSSLVKIGLEQMEELSSRRYRPRKLPELFVGIAQAAS